MYCDCFPSCPEVAEELGRHGEGGQIPVRLYHFRLNSVLVSVLLVPIQTIRGLRSNFVYIPTRGCIHIV